MTTSTITPEAVTTALQTHPQFSDVFAQLSLVATDCDVTVADTEVQLAVAFPTDNGEHRGRAVIAYADHADAAAVAATAHQRLAEVAGVVLSI